MALLRSSSRKKRKYQEEEDGPFENWDKVKSLADVLPHLRQYTPDFIDKFQQYMIRIRKIFQSSKDKRKRIKTETYPPFLEDFDKMYNMLGLFKKIGPLLEHELPRNNGTQQEIKKAKDAEKKTRKDLQRAKEDKDEMNKQMSKLDQETQARTEEVKRLNEELQRKDVTLEEMKSEKLETSREIQKKDEEIEAQVKIINQLKNYKDENATLKSEVTSVNEAVQKQNQQLKELENQKEHLETHIREQADENKLEKSSLLNQCEQKNKEVTELTRSINSLQKTNTQQQKDAAESKVLLREKEKQVEELYTKLAEEMSTKLSSDESSVENVSIKNRPMNIAEDYQLLCSNEWLEAKGAVDDIAADEPDYKKLCMLCEIIKTAEVKAKELLETTYSSLKMLILEPVVFVTGKQNVSDECTDNQKNIPQELSNMVGDILRNLSDSVKVSSLVQNVTDSLHEADDNQLWELCHGNEEVKDYVSAVVRLVWKMVIQRPPMAFKSAEEYKGDKFQDVFWNSDMVSEPRVIEVYPMLYHGNSFMTKGKVLLLDPSKF